MGGWGGAVEQIFGAIRDWWSRKYDGASREAYTLEQEAEDLDRAYREALDRLDTKTAIECLHRLWGVRDKLLARSGEKHPQ